MAGETFAFFLVEDPNTTALPLPFQAGDRIAVVRGTAPNERTYYAAAPPFTPYILGPGDGQKGIDGAILAFSPTILDAATMMAVNGGVTAAYVGEPVTIEQAGANFFAIQAVFVAGGTGYRVDDTIVFPGDVVIRVQAVNAATGAVLSADANAVQGWIIVDGGESTTNPAGAQNQTGTFDAAGTPGPGTGVQFSFTWQRVNLITTIAAINSDTQIVLAEGSHAGVDIADIEWGFATDVSAAINAHLATTLAQGGDRRLTFPGGILGIASTINYVNGNALLGGGTSGTRDATTGLMWIGPHRGTMVSNGDPAAPVGVTLEGISFFGMGAAAKGLQSHGDSGGTYSQLSFTGFQQIAWDIDASALSAVGLRIPFVGGDIRNISITANRTASNYCRGIVIGRGTGIAASDTNRTDFTGIRIAHRYGTGFEINSNDSTTIRDYFGNSALGLSFEGRCSPVGAPWDYRMFDTQMIQLQPIGGMVVRGTNPTRPPTSNMVFGYSGANGSTAPIIEPSAECLIVTARGRNFGTAPSGLWVATADALVNDITLTPMISGGSGAGSHTIRGGTLQVGTRIRMEARGVYTTPAANAATLTVNAAVNSASVGTIILLTTSTPPIMPASAVAKPLWVTVMATVRAVGAAGQIVTDGVVFYNGAADNGTVNQITMVPAVVNLDTTVDLTLTLEGRWSTVAGGQLVTLQNGSYQWDMGGQGGLW